MNLMNRLQTGIENRWDRVVGKLKYRQAFGHDGFQFLFQIGHMRSGSSLLQHVLCSNPMVAGYGETHWKYSNLGDMQAIASRISRKTKDPEKGGYFMDKVIHARLIPDPSVLSHPFVKVVVLLRQPSQTLSSLLKLKGVHNPDQAYHHYKHQMEWMLSISSKLDRKKIYPVEYEKLTNSPEDTLAGITQFLELRTQLKPSYKVTETSGKAGIGDPGKYIHEGEINNKIDREIDSRVEDYLEDAERVYQSCLGVLGSVGE